MKKLYEAKIIDHSCDEDDKTGLFKLNFIANSKDDVRKYIIEKIIGESKFTENNYCLKSIYEIQQLRSVLECVKVIRL